MDGRFAAAPAAEKRLRRENAVPGGNYLDRQTLVPDIRVILQPLDIFVRNKFQPDCLPNPGCPCVIAALRGVGLTLLAPRLLAAAVIIPGADYDLVFTNGQKGCNIDAKRCISAFVRTRLLPVDPHEGFIIHRAKV